MANDNTARDTDHAWDLMKKIGFAMLVTHDGDKLRARPMSAYLERENNAIYFLTDARRHKDDEIARNPNVNLSFADASDQNYVSVSGTAVVSNDRAKIKQLFTTTAKAWWDSAEDPNIRVLKFTPDDAEFWDSRGTVIRWTMGTMAAADGTDRDRRQWPARRTSRRKAGSKRPRGFRRRCMNALLRAGGGPDKLPRTAGSGTGSRPVPRLPNRGHRSLM